MNRYSLGVWILPITILLVCLLSFGTMLHKLHFYWDDWTIVYYIHFLGSSSFQEAFSVDRPLLAGFYKLTTSLLGESSINWQIYALLMRWLCCLALWWTLKGLWPRKVFQVSAITLLFAVYPGFNQQYIAITYGNAFLFYTLFLISLGLMIWAFRKPSWFWPLYLSSILLSGYCMFLVEYFFGLELLRPIFLWLLINERNNKSRQGLKQKFFMWLPYLILMILFLGWRISTPTPRAEIDIFEQLASGPFSTTISLLWTVMTDFLKVSFAAWGQVLNFNSLLNSQANGIIRYLAISILAALISFFLLSLLSKNNQESHNQNPSNTNHWAYQAILIGALSLIVAGIPIWMTNLRIELFFPWDRFTLPMMPGTAMLFVGLITLIIRQRIINILIISSLVGLAAGLHYQNALSYRKDWLQVRNFFWQLTWRAPGIEPGTLILAPELPFEYNWDNSLTAPLNWTFAPENTALELPYLLYNLETRLSLGLPIFKENASILEEHRITPFNGNTSQSLLITYQPPACLKVIDPISDQYIPNKPRYFHEALPFSHPDLIILDAVPSAKPPLHLLGPEPEHDWCYYFEKAELARQEEDWDEVIKLGNEALKLKKKFYKPNAAELAPFIEGYARSGHWEEALNLSIRAYDAWENMNFMLCDLWHQISQTSKLDSEGQKAYQEIVQSLECEHP
jgi:hypothetical protein